MQRGARFLDGVRQIVVEFPVWSDSIYVRINLYIYTHILHQLFLCIIKFPFHDTDPYHAASFVIQFSAFEFKYAEKNNSIL